MIAAYISKPLILSLLSLFCIFLIIALGSNLIPYNHLGPVYNYYYSEGSNVIESVLSNWDGQWFVYLAENGWGYQGNSDPGVAKFAFFPLYPAVIKLVHTVSPLSTQAAGISISIISTILSSFVLFRLTSFSYPGRETNSIIFFLINPVIIFYYSVYADALFLCLTLLTTYQYVRRKTYHTGLFLFFSTLTRSQGFLLALSLAIERLINRDKNYHKRSQFLDSLVILATSLAGLILKISLDKYYSQSWFAYFKAVQWWQLSPNLINNLTKNYNTIMHVSQLPLHVYGSSKLDVLFFVTYICIIIFMIVFKLRLSYILYSILILLIVINSGTLSAGIKYYSVAFPIYITLALLSHKSKIIESALIVSSTIFMVFFSALFINWHWVS